MNETGTAYHQHFWFSFLGFFCLFSSGLYAQLVENKTVVEYDAIEKIVFVDQQDLRSMGFYMSVYALVPSESKWRLFRVLQYYDIKDPDIRQDIDLDNSLNKLELGHVEASLVQNLVQAINDTASDPLRIGQFNFSDTALFAPVARAVDYLPFTPDEDSLIESFFTSDSIRQSGLEKLYSSYWTYDYPECKMYIISATDTLLLLSSQQEPYMLPWQIADKRESFNPMISKYMAAIFPEKRYANIDRISGQDFEYLLGEILFETYCIPALIFQRNMKAYADEIDLIRNNLSLLQTEFESNSAIDFHGEYAKMILHTSSLPENIYIEAKLSISDGKLFPPQRLIDGAKQSAKQLNKYQWLTDWIGDTEGMNAYVHFTDTMSMTRRAISFFRNDTKLFVDHYRLVDDLNNSMLITVSLDDDYSRWILLPDGRIILWHYRGRKALPFAVTKTGHDDKEAKSLIVVGKFVQESGIAD